MGKFNDYAALMRLDKPIGSALLLWPTLWALWIAGEGQPDVLIVTVFVGGVFVMRSAGCVINDLADKDVDPHVERTRDRPLAAGRVSVREAVGLFAVLVVLAFALVLLMNTFTIALSFAGIVLAMTYPLMKRVTYLPQAYLGIAFGWGIPMAFAAHLNTVPLLGWFLLATNIIWAIAYDTMYAMADRDDDLQVGVKSSAILFGRADRLIVGVLQVTTLGMLAALGLIANFGWIYALGIALACGFAVYQQVLISGREPAKCFAAFLNNTWFGGVVFAGIVLDYAAR
jgi:4-hydroxybenzoate polyprenyltransferase